MKSMRLATLFCLSSLIISATSTTFAGTMPQTITFSAGAGEYFFANQRSLHTTGIYFGAIGYNFTEHWGLEGLFGFLNTHFDSNIGDHRQVEGRLFAVDTIYHFSPYYFVEPYVMFGVGMVSLSPNRNEANDEGNINAGLGLQFFANRFLSFRAEARDFYTMVGGKNDVMVDGVFTFALPLC